MTAIYSVPGYTIPDLNAVRPLNSLVEIRADGTHLDGTNVTVAEYGDYLIEYTLGVRLDKGSNKSANLVRSYLYAAGVQISLDQTPLSISAAYTNYTLSGSGIVTLGPGSPITILVGKAVKIGGNHLVDNGVLKITKL